jgi:hypothetical protein
VVKEKKEERAYPIKELSSHTSPSIHPTVVSPLKLRHDSTISNENFFPATKAVNRIKAVAAMYQITWRRTIWEKIFRGGSSVRAPGRGGRRRRAMICEIYLVKWMLSWKHLLDRVGLVMPGWSWS